MKIFKERRHALFNRPIQIAGVDYLSIGLMLYFDLTAPEDLHNEQDLWKDLVALMGADLVLDQGWPKPHGEILLAGAAVAPGGHPTPATQVRLRCGPIDKTLRVFGDRFWLTAALGRHRMTEPNPFTRMPIDWKHAFGGPDFADNPLGKGVAANKPSDDGTPIALPNVEGEPLVATPDDRPRPASFGSVDMMWPARAKKHGTYDDAWLQQRWPAFPDDMNYAFFCMAPEDQQLPGHFDGREVIEIEGMHKERPVIRSRLPHRRVRAFVTRRDIAHPKDLSKAVFEEVGLKPETLWLFPDILRGVILWRGLTRASDDQYSDLARLLVKDEDSATEPTPVTAYRDEQLRKADLGVPFDPNLQTLYADKMGEAAKKTLNLPKKIKAQLAAHQGQVPVPRYQAADLERLMGAQLVQTRAAIETIEATAKDLHARFGHIAPINFGAIAKARAQADKMQVKLADLVARGKAIEQRKAEMLDKAKGIMKRPELEPLLAKAGISDPNTLLARPPEPPFHARAFPLLTSWRLDLLLDASRLRALTDLGLRRETIKNRWLAWNPQPRQEQSRDWGIEPKPGAETLSIPAGLVMPRFDGAKLVGLLVRDGEMTDPGVDVSIPGSLNTPLFLEAASEQGVLVLVADELSAAYAEQEAGDFAHVTVCRTPAGPLAKAAKEALQAGALAVVVLPEAGAWAGKEPQFLATFRGCRFARLPDVRDVFSAHIKGLDLRQAIVEQLPPEGAGKHALIFDSPGQKPRENAKKLTDILSAVSMAALIKDGVNQGIAAKRASMDERIAPFMKQAEEAKARMAAAGFTGAAPDAKGPRPMTEELNERADQVKAVRDKMKAKGALPPDKEAEFDKAIARMRDLGPQLDAQKSQGMAQLKAFQPPAEAKAAFAKAGIDPAKLRPQAPAFVIGAAKGQGDVRGATIQGEDFSGMDLAGIDLSNARVSHCLFKGTNLSGARFDRTMVQQCDFTGADLSKSELLSPVFKTCVLDHAVLTEARGNMPVIQDSSLKQADFSHTDFSQLVVQKSVLDGLILTDARVLLSIFAEGQAEGLKADGARFEKTVFKKLSLDKASFLGLTTDALLLHGCTGAQVSFAGSELFKFRISHDSAFPGLVLRGVTWKHGYCRTSNLAGADFQGANLERTIFESCDLSSANLAKARLFRCRFPKSNLEGATLRHANLMLSSLRQTRLVKTDLRDANCYAVDFFKAVFGETRMQGANLKRSFIAGREDVMRREGMIA
ncbi:Type III effector pipB2 [Thiorhodovibrio winogradskyi]|uniref:Type III effector pipB2 n=1 Tax=Thiorhodovibrio winogradskyi TaxID=77007 RepID=A0ABZ0S8L5_9GAMM|nr:DUF2169 domain-containing protein [Thiorhodovibrio winogradskyi]